MSRQRLAPGCAYPEPLERGWVRDAVPGGAPGMGKGGRMGTAAVP